jgi:hypothetical protein
MGIYLVFAELSRGPLPLMMRARCNRKKISPETGGLSSLVPGKKRTVAFQAWKEQTASEHCKLATLEKAI